MKIQEENTLRVLKDQLPLQNWRCRWGWHRWTTWIKIAGNRATFSDDYYECECADCNKPRVCKPTVEPKVK